MRRRNRERKLVPGAKLEMTPMIDVVFLLLVFFIVSIRPQDILAKLDVSRPAASQESIIDIPILRIDIGKSDYIINGRIFSLKTIEKHLSRIYVNSPKTTLTIACTGNASHSQLVKLLNSCSKIGIKNISLMSL